MDNTNISCRSDYYEPFDIRKRASISGIGIIKDLETNIRGRLKCVQDSGDLDEFYWIEGSHM